MPLLLFFLYKCWLVVEFEAREAPVRYGVGFFDPVSMLCFFKLLLLKGNSVLRFPPFGGC